MIMTHFTSRGLSLTQLGLLGFKGGVGEDVLDLSATQNFIASPDALVVSDAAGVPTRALPRATLLGEPPIALPVDFGRHSLRPLLATEKSQIVADQNYKATLMNLLDSARASIDIVHFNFYSEDGTVREIFDKLIERARAGVKIRLFLEGDHGEVGKRNRATITRFYAEIERIAREEGIYLNIEIIEDSEKILTHTKAVCIDGEILFFGSTNWSNTSIGKNNETNMLVRSPELCAAFREYFARLVAEPQKLFSSKTDLGNTTFYTDAAHYDDIREMIQTAKTSLDAAMYFFRPISNAPIKKALKNILPDGVHMTDVLKGIVTELAHSHDLAAYLRQYVKDKSVIAEILRAIAVDNRVRAMMDDFAQAVIERGVDVKIMLEDNTGTFGADVAESNILAEIYMREKIAAAGGNQTKLKIYFENPNKISHSKYLIKDGQVVMMGTSNWFVGDLFRNHNTNIRMVDPDFAKALRAHHLQKIAYETQRVRGEPMIRFWVGYADPSANEIADPKTGETYFLKGLKQVLIPHTTVVGAERGLIGYFPMVLHLPDETLIEAAMVIYADQETYDAIRATPEGERYGLDHFEIRDIANIPELEDLEGRKLFSRDLGDGRKSGSAVAEHYRDNVAFGKSYTLFPDKNRNWQQSVTVSRIIYRQSKIDDETYRNNVANYLKERQTARGSLSHIVRVEKDFIIEYAVATDEAQLTAFLTAMEARSWDRLTRLSDEETQSRDFDLVKADGTGCGFQLVFPTEFESLIRDE